MNSFLKLSLILSLAFILPYACTQPTGNTSDSNTKMDQPISGDKIVYIDIDTLLNKYELYLDKKAALEEQSKAAEKSLSGKIEAFQRKMAKFQQEIANIQQNAASYAPVELKKLEEKYAQQQMNLAKEEESLMKQRDNAAMDLESKLQETQKDLQNKIDEYLEKVAETKGYDYVLMKGVGGSVMFGRKALDITQETLRELNEQYANSNKKDTQKQNTSDK